MRAGIFEFAVTTEILEEYEEVIGEFYSPTLAANVIDLLSMARNCIWTTPHYRWNLIPDQDDNKFIDCAMSCQADYIITHNRHFNVLADIPFPKIRTLKMSELKAILRI